jgi:eukaryotic-like serine/threonine-protein kinase
MRSYEPIFELGRGGMGVVSLACGRGAGGFQNLVVIKRLHEHLTADPRAVKRFLNEAKVAGLIHHANVVGTHYVGEDESGYFLVIDYVEGLSLDDLSERAKERGIEVPLPIILRVALDALSGLSAVHDAADPGGQRLNLLHRDVSPHNLLVGRDGVTRLADFGVARSDMHRTTENRYLIGKLCYLPREYLQRKELWPNSDIYSLSVSLWSVLVAHEPWPQADEVQLLRHIVDERLPALALERPVSDAVNSLFSCGTDPDRTKRYQTARDMADAIEAAAAAGEPIATSREVADFVHRLAGKELVERAERVATWFAHKSSTAPPPDAASSGSFSQRPTVSPGGGTTQGSSQRFPLWPAVAAFTIFSATGTLVVLSLRSEQQAASSPVPGSGASSLATLAALPPQPSLSAGPVPVTVPVLEASALPLATSGEPSNKRLAPARTRVPAQAPATPRPGQRLPSQITKSNPYLNER